MNSRISNFIDRVFEGEEMNGGYGWTLARIGWMQIRLHHFTKDDWLGDMHDHPGRCISIGLKGRYREETPEGARIYRAPWLRTFPASHTHRIVMVDGGTCWTVAITLKPVRTCGVFSSAGWMPFEEYLKDIVHHPGYQGRLDIKIRNESDGLHESRRYTSGTGKASTGTGTEPDTTTTTTTATVAAAAKASSIG